MKPRKYRKPPWAKARITNAHFKAFFGERVSAVRKAALQAHARQKIIYTSYAEQGVREFALQFKPTLPGIRKLIDYVAGFQLIGVDQNVARKLYAQRRASEIIASKKIPMSEAMGAWGCNDQVIALIATMRSMGLKDVNYVRTILNYHSFTLDKQIQFQAPHSISLFRFKGKKYIADPWADRMHRFVRVTPEMEVQIQRLKSWNIWIEALDPSQVGLISFLHFKDILKGARVPKGK